MPEAMLSRRALLKGSLATGALTLDPRGALAASAPRRPEVAPGDGALPRRAHLAPDRGDRRPPRLPPVARRAGPRGPPPRHPGQPRGLSRSQDPQDAGAGRDLARPRAHRARVPGALD